MHASMVIKTQHATKTSAFYDICISEHDASLLVLVQSCGTVEDEEEDKNKWKVLELPGGDAPLSHVSDKDMQIMIDHFTNFAVVGEANSSQEADAQLKFWVFAYYTEPDLKADEDCVTRVYCIPATEAAFKVSKYKI